MVSRGAAPTRLRALGGGTLGLVALLAATLSAEASELPAAEVVGGHDAPLGKWPDAVAVYVGTIPLCTGVLVAPTVVLTAAHCNTSGLTDVVIGADALSTGGERIPIARRIEHPSWDTTFDLLVLVLARPSTKQPRPLAAGWGAAEITDGTPVTIVGFGAVNAAGNMYVDRLQEATTTVTDVSCQSVKGCHALALPGGELGAGGMGVDSCSGDSGGPLYAETSFGTVVAGLTSRSYDDARLTCSEGGIYVRAGHVADWIERVAGVAIARTPGPSVDELQLAVGGGGELHISPQDPRPSKHRFELARAPAKSRAAITSSGTLRVCATAEGDDELVVAVIDKADEGRRTYVPVSLRIAPGRDTGDCSLEPDGCGCRSARGSLTLPLLALALLWRRRRR